MKSAIKPLLATLLGVVLLTSGCAKKQTAPFQSLNNLEVVAQLKSFVAEKEVQANAAAKADGQEMPPEFKPFFAAAAKGDWLAVSNQFQDFRKHAPQYQHSGKTDLRLHGTAWQAVLETWGAFESMFVGNEKYSAAYGNDIVASIPPGSIYFGGTDPGRFIITAMCKSQANGDPFFTLTQNALADSTYLDYLRSMYGDKIYIPTPEDQEKSFQNYTQDIMRRQQNGQLKPGENVKVDAASGRVQVSGQGAVMEINGLLAKIIFNKNANQEFYVEESFPLDWMYPKLEPHGLIFKINHQSLSQLPDDVVNRDHDFWTKTIEPIIGGWLKPDTTVEEVTAFAKKVFLRRDFNGFAGDPQFVQNEYSHKMFSKERSSIAGLYAWRMNQAATADEKERMASEADFAFRQALALCPYSPEAVKGYADFLKSQNRDSDAALVSELAKQFPKQE